LLDCVLSKLRDRGIFERFPTIAVLMNKAKPRTNGFTEETQKYFSVAKDRSDMFYKRNNTVKIKCIEAFLKEDDSVKNVFRDDITVDVITQMEKIWEEVEGLF
ncbi:hypothetical protein MBAV_004014, partial [Candidatus Magnetobacterium bavaricum]